MENLIGDLRMVLDPTRPKRSAEDILKEPSPLLPAPRAPAKAAKPPPKRIPGEQI
jgi:hypothetical protein